LRFDHQQAATAHTLRFSSERRDYWRDEYFREQLEIVRLSGDEQKLQAQGSHPRKMALPFVCVVFGLVGAALGTTQHGRATGFGISVVVIFSYYYSTLSAMRWV